MSNDIKKKTFIPELNSYSGKENNLKYNNGRKKHR